ncbi:MAG: hypothetical protein IJI45_16320 [Anaerolineaceae bacterium]|nr:hypothetical protein [Anaerolineaceae bacterium]
MAGSIRIADTTREEREQIVAESIGNISGLCDGCSPGIIEMYQDYIDGRKELREINAEFQTGYMSGAQGPEHANVLPMSRTIEFSTIVPPRKMG